MQLTRYTAPETPAWSPFQRFTSLRDELDRLFDFAFPTARRESGFFGGWAPAVDVTQDKENVYVRAELPGMKKDEIEVTLHEGIVSLSGERKSETEEKSDQVYRSERYFGRFHRSVALPTAVDAEKITASYKDGVLTVTLPKAEEAKPRQIEVKVS